MVDLVPNRFPAVVAYDTNTGNTIKNAVAEVYATDDTSFTSPLPLLDLTGVSMPNLVSSNDGVYPPFIIDSETEYVEVYAKSGTYVTPVISYVGTRGADGEPGPAGPAGAGVPDIEDSTAGQVVTSTGPATPPIWADPAGGGSGVPNDGSVSSAKIINGAVTETKLADGAVSTAKLADGSVTSAKIADGTIVDADISGSAAISQSKISGLTAALAGKVTAPADPNADRILFWDDSAGVFTFLTAGSGLSISGTTITATGGSGSSDILYSGTAWPSRPTGTMLNWKSTLYDDAGRPPGMVDGDTWMFHPDDPDGLIP